jgi:hypothetical protein
MPVQAGRVAVLGRVVNLAVGERAARGARLGRAGLAVEVAARLEPAVAGERLEPEELEVRADPEERQGAAAWAALVEQPEAAGLAARADPEERPAVAA